MRSRTMTIEEIREPLHLENRLDLPPGSAKESTHGDNQNREDREEAQNLAIPPRDLIRSTRGRRLGGEHGDIVPERLTSNPVWLGLS